MLKKGLTIAQIAAKRELVTTTIEGHLSFFVSKGELDIDRLASADVSNDTSEALRTKP